MIDFVMGKRNIVLALAIMFVVVSLSGTTYSLFFKTEVTNTFNYSTGLLELEIAEDEQIVLSNAFPTIDSEGMKSKPYKLTIKNTGSLAYLFDLKMLSSTADNTIDTKYIKVMTDNEIPSTLYKNSGIIASNVILYPNEEHTFNIRLWLDYNTPNQELGKSFIAKITASGESIYKTLDNSNANIPEMESSMLPVYYDESTNKWQKTSSDNLDKNHLWYNYGEAKWANVVMIKDSKKQIYDITGHNHLPVSEAKTNNRNIILGDDYLDLKLPYKKNIISSIIRIKIDDLETDKVYIMSNDKMTYYYDTKLSKFIFKVNGATTSSLSIDLQENKWYIIGYTYDGNKVTYYLDGQAIGSTSLSENIITNSTFKIGTDQKVKQKSKITIGDIYIYDRILSELEISTNYKTSINIIYNSLVAGYNEFYPMTLYEYYSTSNNGKVINEEDIIAFYVWIPRFKYKVWNVTGNSVPSYNAYEKGIEISFEKDLTSSGTIYCQKGICYSDNLMITKVTAADNGKYYTHPAFNNGTEEITGFWVSKYEMSNNNSVIESKEGNPITKNLPLTTMYQYIKSIDKNINYHMIKNTEWGAITYLSHSNYGKCINSTCKTPMGNQTYISGTEKLDSTTNNAYGVYDMVGSAAEFVMANYADASGNISLLNPNVPNIVNSDYDLYLPNTFILGDATLEVTTNNQSWDNGLANFINPTNNWFVRGGIATVESDSMYSYRASSDLASEYISTRIIIK